MERVITVRGKGVKRVSPDTIEINFTVKAQDASYDNMIKLSEEQLIAMQNAVERTGFKKKQLRTQNYRIHTVYRDVKKENGEYENVFSGYECKQEFLLKFPMDIQKFNSVLRSIDICEARPLFDINFTLSNSQEARDEALRDAAINAHREAELITEAAGAHLGDLLKIDLTDNCYSFRSMGVNSVSTASSASLSIDTTGTMQPDNITVEVSAEFIWEIK
ncbi:MAG: SIMPL domain-containing protein [Ruminococcus sp.]|nr:SIMPL domain-containing protein [Ruminococcus sp.]